MNANILPGYPEAEWRYSAYCGRSSVFSNHGALPCHEPTFCGSSDGLRNRPQTPDHDLPFRVVCNAVLEPVGYMTVATLATATSAENRKAVIAGTIGNVLEWYDFGVYGYFATTISQLFFPGDDKTIERST